MRIRKTQRETLRNWFGPINREIYTPRIKFTVHSIEFQRDEGCL